MQRVVTALFLFLFLFPRFSHADSARSVEKILGRIPVQEGGRVKPFASFAKEAIIFITGKNPMDGEGATLAIWRWISKPTEWSSRPLLPVKQRALPDYFSSDLDRNRIAPGLVEGLDSQRALSPHHP